MPKILNSPWYLYSRKLSDENSDKSWMTKEQVVWRVRLVLSLFTYIFMLFIVYYTSIIMLSYMGILFKKRFVWLKQSNWNNNAESYIWTHELYILKDEVKSSRCKF